MQHLCYIELLIDINNKIIRVMIIFFTHWVGLGQTGDYLLPVESYSVIIMIIRWLQGHHLYPFNKSIIILTGIFKWVVVLINCYWVALVVVNTSKLGKYFKHNYTKKYFAGLPIILIQKIYKCTKICFKCNKSF